MKRGCIRRQMIQYRFKDSMNCVFFRSFYTAREAHLWYERNKVVYSIREFSCMGTGNQGNVRLSNIAIHL